MDSTTDIQGANAGDGSFSPAIGDVVRTAYGMGVIVACPTADNDLNDASIFYRVLIWRIPGRSVGSSSIAYLQPSAILGTLPAAPGMTTQRLLDDGNSEKVLVQCYYESSDSFFVTPLSGANKDENSNPTDGDEEENEDGENEQTIVKKQLRRLSRLSIAENNLLNVARSSTTNFDTRSAVVVPAKEIEQAPGAKFYPLLQELMRRGDQTAAATSNFLAQPKVSEIVDKTSSLVEASTKSMQKKLEDGAVENSKENIQQVALSVKTSLPTDNAGFQQLMKMLKDEELTVLLEKGKQRLEQLVSTDIPKATKEALEKSGVYVATDADDVAVVEGASGKTKIIKNYKESIQQSRKAALKALEDVLQQAEIDPSDLESLRGDLQKNFGTMLESLQTAAKSDRALSSIFENVSGLTSEWQEATGRLMSTRSASLFMEGASRFQARAAAIFSKDQLSWAGEIGNKFTKAFTEGDAAVARLKSIELGDNVRNRLVRAIEVRSDSLGGLDGIIAGALTTINQRTGGIVEASEGISGDKMGAMLSTLQNQASSARKDAHETLIGLLARRSEYRDVALLKVEQVMCDLESQLGDDLSPEDIAAIARGDGGTAKLFEPIAKRAAKEIEKQLDAAEASVSDQTIIDVLKHVRKIVSGELTIGAVMDELVNILNDDKIVAAGETLVKHGENVLDAIEGVSGNKVVDDVVQIVEKAGITKDSVMQGIEKLNVDEILDTAGNAMTDESARQKLLSDATDTALDFILRILPSMPVPPLDGVKDGLVYHVSNLSMQGFKVRKENIVVEVAGMRATKKQQSPTIVTIPEGDDFQTIKPQGSFDSAASNDGRSHSPPRTPTRPSAKATASPQRKHWRSESAGSGSFLEVDTSTNEGKRIKATELLIIDIQKISAVFNDAVWSFEQTYLPYLKGNGKVDVKMSDGAIRLVFELRRRRKDGLTAPQSAEFKAEEWEPVLCLHNRSCSIDSINLTMQGGGRVAWVVNKLAAVFKGVLRDYVVRSILNILSDRSGWILAKLNEGLHRYWGLVLKTAKLDMEELEVAGTNDIVAAKPPKNTNHVELVWREPIPLGMNLLLNDESGLLKVVDFPRGSQARTVCEKRKLNPEVFKGATVVAVNGQRFVTDEDLFDALRDPSRPKTVSFELANAVDAERIRKFVQRSKGEDESEETEIDREFFTRPVTFTAPGELGIEFANSADNFGLVIRKFVEGEDGIVLAAERHENIGEGDLLTHINGRVVLGKDGEGRKRATQILEAEGDKRPLSLTFADPYVFHTIFKKPTSAAAALGGPSEVILEEKKFDPKGDARRIVVKGFKEVDGMAENSGVLIGDQLVFVNGNTVGAGCKWLGDRSPPSLARVMEMITDETSYPIGLTFARPKNAEKSSYWSSPFGSPTKKEGPGELTIEGSETICVTADEYGQLGCMLDNRNSSDVVVTDLVAVSGPFQGMMERYKDKISRRHHLSIDSVNGQFVPGYATTKMVTSAMERSWKSDNQVELTLLDDQKRSWTQALKDDTTG